MKMSVVVANHKAMLSNHNTLHMYKNLMKKKVLNLIRWLIVSHVSRVETHDYS